MKIFLYDSEKEYELNDTEDDDNINLEKSIEKFYELSEYEGSFFGIVTPDDRTVQFLYQSDDNWLLDIPSKDNPQEYFVQKQLTYDECIKVITSLFNGITVDEIQANYIVKT